MAARAASAGSSTRRSAATARRWRTTRSSPPPGLTGPSPRPVPGPAGRGQGGAGARPPRLRRDLQGEHLHIRALQQAVRGRRPAGCARGLPLHQRALPGHDACPTTTRAASSRPLGRFAEAGAQYDRAHEKDPRSAVPLWNAYFLRVGRLRDPSGAERVARALVALQPEFGNAQHTLAWSLVMQRRFAEAEEGMRAIPEARPREPVRAAEPRPPAPAAGSRGRGGGGLPPAGPGRRRGAQEAQPGPRCAVPRARPPRGRAGGRGASQLCAQRPRPCARGQAAGLRPPVVEAQLAALLAGAGRTAEARAHLSKAEAAGEAKGETAAWLARAHVALGELHRATALYEHAVLTGYGDPYYVLIDPTLAAIRDRPGSTASSPREPRR